MDKIKKLIKWLIEKSKPKKGFVYVEGDGGGLANKGQQYKGNYDVEILAETETMYRIKFTDLPVYQNKWVKKEFVTLV